MRLTFQQQMVRRAFGSVFCVATALGIAGCAGTPTRPPNVPESAMVKAEGDKGLVYIAEDSGMAFVSDEGDRRIVWSGQVRRGDRLVLDPKENKLTLNDQVVMSKDVSANNHRIFLQPGAAPPMAPVGSTDANVARPAGVPQTAMVKGAGKERVEYTADQDGTLWVADADKDAVVYTARVYRGDRVLLNTKDNQILVNGRPVYDKSLPNDTYRLFLEPGVVVVVPTEAAARVLAAPPAVVVTPPAVPVVVTPVAVPAGAILWSDSGRASLTAPANGTMWVADPTTNQVVFTTKLVKGDAVTVDPPTGRLNLNGKPIVQSALPTGRIYFQAAP